MIVHVIECRAIFEGKEIFVERISPNFYRKMNFPYRSDFCHFDKCFFVDDDIEIKHKWLAEREVSEDDVVLYEVLPSDIYASLIFKSDFFLDS